MNVIFWLISALLNSFSDGYRKKSLNITTLPKNIYLLFWPFSGFFVIWIIIYISGINSWIYFDYKIIWLILLIIVFDIISNFLEINVYKKTKLSQILPYTNLDKLFIVLIWFFLFYWTQNSTSITTFIITLITIVVIILFSFDFKNLKIPKTIIKYSFVMMLRWISMLIVWFIFLQYSTIDYLSINILFLFIWYLLIAILLKESFKTLTLQSKQFYISRWFSLILGWSWFIIWLYIIKNSWVLIATLISFVWLVFNVLAMKFILNDNPQKKQIVLAWLVTVLIWIWFYFK